MSFYHVYKQLKLLDFEGFLNSVTSNDIKRILHKDLINDEDFLMLLSPAAEECLEALAQKAHRVTVQHFGKTIQLFNPIYISDHCVNHCTYCSFSVTNQFKRQKLTMEEVDREAKNLASNGIKHILILTGESKLHSSVSYIKETVEVLKKYFSSISIEINPLDTEEYKQLREAGVDGVTVYQEVYNEDVYRDFHVKGPKRNYRYRLDTPERGCEAGLRSVNIGTLLGLDNWRKEVFFTGMHANYLQNKYIDTEIGLSLPRIRPHLGNFNPRSEVNDKAFVQSLVALRLLLPRSGITLSTRESAVFRDHLIPLGITRMSAGASTEVGGYSLESQGTNQFQISDERGVRDICDALYKKGYQPIFKDWIHS
ncbi:2-iminoacetate synthase ThiH [Halalkalibacter alkalisediminis]|uniref:2-iminoacetate synthase ThiH n=1 Tax=Halalkalibacter alkalisediminis TaxID=935616 RepID=A0ABV6NCE0_9BACI|nr:2-iminoacetate synthase ThiH [Halalkalibacter alkalisediminis]